MNLLPRSSKGGEEKSCFSLPLSKLGFCVPREQPISLAIGGHMTPSSNAPNKNYIKGKNLHECLARAKISGFTENNVVED